MTDDRGPVIPLPSGPDHGSGPLGRVADAFLTAQQGTDAHPEIVMIYNILADAPGQAGYAVLRLEDKMWSLAPSVADTFDLLVHLATNAELWEPTEVCRSARHRPDGIAMTYRALMVDTSTDAGRAIFANHEEGYYRHGDVAAAPAARSVCFATAVDRAGGSASLVRLDAGGPVEDLRGAFGLPKATRLKSTGVTDTGLVDLLAAMHARWRRLLT
ncbi:hypothetical protein I6A84_01690 [Frankia sp. CNm7]|uniref:Uncharacterized protein n=1 Tax=Frankia nepalensis TaxID=1836974 RepID=A0A937UQ58_9ACTN|nr:hypothetical protein [Frankia nepalensis]MBL7498142.1 hypothetical protein [Frankia nepalensis]MBL7509340.1 hypothetical protein [Frankia nepalensis]MBL7516872.1 hypothetical protein [Frankia nepalensis]MBL7627930.1 hypothetical protein [Frankia nepalensis]